MLRMACQGSCTKMPEDCTTIVVSLFEAHEQNEPSSHLFCELCCTPRRDANGDGGYDGIRCADLSHTATFVWLAAALMGRGWRSRGEKAACK